MAQQSAEATEGNIVHLFAGSAYDYEADPDPARLERAIARLRKLLNDPEALRRRAAALIAGTAQPLLAAIFVGLTAVRMVAGPPAPGYFAIVWHRRPPVAVAVAATVPQSEVA